MRQAVSYGGFASASTSAGVRAVNTSCAAGLSPVKVLRATSDRRYGAGRITVKPNVGFGYRNLAPRSLLALPPRSTRARSASACSWSWRSAMPKVFIDLPVTRQGHEEDRADEGQSEEHDDRDPSTRCLSQRIVSPSGLTTCSTSIATARLLSSRIGLTSATSTDLSLPEEASIS